MVTSFEDRKRLGQVFTPNEVARTLVRWSVRKETDRMLDPSCGDGRFLAYHRPSIGIELDPRNAALAQINASGASIYCEDFFKWASSTSDRFEVAVGNPPFIRYQHFAGETRQLALELTRKLSVNLNGLASSWAAFLVIAASLLKPGGRMAFVVPAEIGHAPYASPVLNFLCSHFQQVRIVAIREKLFPKLSEVAWLLFADGFGRSTDVIELSLFDKFSAFTWTDQPTRRVAVSSWQAAGCRLRKFILAENALFTYQSIASRPGVTRLGEIAVTSIGYVSGANEFFHLRPSEVKRYGIPGNLLRVTIRRARQLPAECVDRESVKHWIAQDEKVMLLDLRPAQELPAEVTSYLNSERGRSVRTGYKCRNRDPWYAIPDVRVPDGFLSYMSGKKPVLVRNDADCVCTNSVHAVFRKNGMSLNVIQEAWSHPLVDLSCELEGHPLGGGLLKLEPREASNIIIPIDGPKFSPSEIRTLRKAASEMREWRNYG